MNKIFYLISIFLFFTAVWGCGGTTSYMTYQAKPSSDTYNFYSNGIPITSYSNNQTFVLLTAQETSLFNDAYIRVWLLIQNNSDSTYVLKPYDIIELDISTPQWHYYEKNGNYLPITEPDSYSLKPQSPSVILSTIDAEKNTELILKSIGGALKAMAVEGTTIKDNNGNVYSVNDKEEKREKIIDRTNNELNNTANWYNMFERSFNAGVLRVNTLFPHKSINGYVYFHLPSYINGSSSGSVSLPNVKDCKFVIKLKLDNTTKIIELSPYNVW